MDIFNIISNEKKYKKEYLTNEIIFTKNDLCSSIFLINSGKIALCKNNKICKIIYKNEIIGLDLIFSNNPFYDYDYKSLELTSLVFISKDVLFNELTNPLFSLSLLNFYSETIKELTYHNSLLSYQNEQERVINFLYLEYKKKNSTSFVIALTKAELSVYLNIDRKNLSKIFSDLINKNIIANQNKLYTLIDLNYFINY